MSDQQQPAISRRRFLQGAGAAVAIAATSPANAFARTAPKRAPSLKGLSHAVKGALITPDDGDFLTAAHVYNERFDAIKPLAVARPGSAAEVQAAVAWAVNKGIPLRARSGGHSYAGYSTLGNGVILDLRELNGVLVDRAAGLANVGAGVQLIDLYAKLAAARATVPAGSCPSVGVSGVSLGGGMGLAGRAYGMTADHIVSARIVTADGRLLHVNERSHPDLLWALRGGGGGNFGIVTNFTFKLRPLPASATYFFLSWPWASAAEALHAWVRWAPHTDSRITSIFRLTMAGDQPTVGVSGQFLGPVTSLHGLIKPMLDLPGSAVVADSEAYLPLQLRWAGCAEISQAACHTVGAAPEGTLERAYFNAKSDYIAKPLSERGASTLISAVESRGDRPGSGAVLFDSYGGAINRVAPDATAFVHRDQLCAIQYLSYNGGSEWLQRTWQAMRPYVSGQAYQNYIDADLKDWQHAYYAGNYARLLATRREYDPHHVFDFRQAIGR